MFEVLQPVEGKPVKMWTKGVAVEEGAKDQLRQLAKLPFIYRHIVALPDIHGGIGSTIGSVIPTKGAIMPAAVGVDMNCLDRDTEYLTGDGWIKISEYNGYSDILQYDPITDEASFVYPLAYIKTPTQWMYHFKHSQGLDQVLSDRHKILFYKDYNKIRGSREYSIEICEDFIKHHETLLKGRAGGFLTVFNKRDDVSELQTKLTDEEIRVQIMVSADGCLRDRGYCEVHVSKEFKIRRIPELLNNAKIKYKIYHHSDNTKTFAFIPPINSKLLNFVYLCSKKQLEIIYSEIFLWDGTIAADGQKTYYTTSKENADAIQYVLACCGIRAGIYLSSSKKENHKNLFQVYTTKNVYVNMAPNSTHPIEKIPTQDGFSYCFTVPSGFLVVRRNNNIFITGNCGMMAVQTSLTILDLPPSVKSIRERIERWIPVGRTHWNHDQDEGAWSTGEIPQRVVDAWYGYLTESVNYHLKKLFENFPELRKANHIWHLGTLGTGNHFIELCLDEEDKVWIMLHSGSRGIGGQIAKAFINEAKEEMERYFIHLENKDHAYLVENTETFELYNAAINWTSMYARLNRELMMDAVIDVLRRCTHIPEFFTQQRINCHHNYVTREHHFGENVWVTRKGAVQARKGTWGIIPGSMGECSFIVQGKGNPESFMSCSHGAGRVMSRNKAKKIFTVEDLQRETFDVECRKDEGILDEIPTAYKNIDAVMAAQEDLVEVKHTLKQFLCVKGEG